MTEPYGDKLVRFQLVWPDWLSRQARVAARAQALPLAAWVRQAVIEKLARDAGR